MRFIDLAIIILIILAIGWLGLKNKLIYGEAEEFMVEQENHSILQEQEDLTSQTPLI
jgi:hypothetical protein